MRVPTAENPFAFEYIITLPTGIAGVIMPNTGTVPVFYWLFAIVSF